MTWVEIACLAIFVGCAYLAYGLSEAKEIGRRFLPGKRAAFAAKMARDVEITVALAAACTPQRRLGEPEPPWLAFPHLDPFHILWRMGAGEDYIYGVFWPFWRILDQTAREDYFRRYDLGLDWPDRDAWYYGWVDDEDAD